MKLSLMPDPVECFTYIAENGSNFFAVIYRLAEHVIYMKKLTGGRVTRDKA